MEMRPTIRNVAPVADWKFAFHSSNFPCRAQIDSRMRLPARCRDKGGKGDVKRKYSRILITRFYTSGGISSARFCIPMNISCGVSVPEYTTVYSLVQHRPYERIKARYRSMRALRRSSLFSTSTINQFFLFFFVFFSVMLTVNSHDNREPLE